MIEFWLERIDVDLWLWEERRLMIHSLEAPSSWRTSKCNITSSPAWVGGTRSATDATWARSSRAVSRARRCFTFLFQKFLSLSHCETLHVVLYYRVFKSIKSIRGACRVHTADRQTRVASQSGRPAFNWCFRSVFNGPNMNMNRRCRENIADDPAPPADFLATRASLVIWRYMFKVKMCADLRVRKRNVWWDLWMNGRNESGRGRNYLYAWPEK
jgi:hypothetical protein